MNSQLALILTNIKQFLEATLFKIGKEPISLLWIIKFTLALIILIVITNICRRFLKNQLLVRLGLMEGHRQAISTLITYSVGALGFLLVLQLNGFDLAPLLVALGGLGVGLGFGLQDIIKNLVSGLTLLIEGKLRVGDYVEFTGLTGQIKEISIRSTIVHTFDGGDVVVPNSYLTGERVLNRSYKDLLGKLHLRFSLDYNNDTLLITETLLDSAYLEPAVLDEPSPKVLFKGFGNNSLEFELWVWVARIDEGKEVESSLNFIIHYKFRQAGIKISSPQEFRIINPEIFSRNNEHSVVDRENSSNKVQIRNSSDHSISIRDALQKLLPFKTCSDLPLRRLIQTGHRLNLAESVILFSEGETGKNFYLILSGSIETVVIKLQEQIKIYQAGELLGEVPAMFGIPYLATARTLEETSIFVIRKGDFEKLLNIYPDLAEAFAIELTKEKEIYLPVRQHLEELGLLNINEQDGGFVSWAKTRLKKIFSYNENVK